MAENTPAPGEPTTPAPGITSATPPGASAALDTPPVAPPETPPAETPPGTPPAETPPGTPPEPKPDSWYHGLNEELTGVVEAKQWGSLEDIVTSYHNLEKLQGVPSDQLMRVPEKADDPAWNEVWAKLGVPGTPEEYKLAVPEGDDGAFAKKASVWFKDANIPVEAARKITEAVNADNAARAVKAEEDYHASIKTDTEALQKDLGLAFEDKMNVAKGVYKAFELTKEQVDGMEAAMGYGPLMKFLMNIGERMGEANFIAPGGGGGDGGVMTPLAAQAEITKLKADSDFAKKYSDGNVDAKDKMERLHMMAYPTIEVHE